MRVPLLISVLLFITIISVSWGLIWWWILKRWIMPLVYRRMENRLTRRLDELDPYTKHVVSITKEGVFVNGDQKTGKIP